MMVSLKNISAPSEGIQYEQTEVTAVWNGEWLGPGHLYVAETRVSWFDGSGMGFSLEYPSISLHAISRDLTTYPKEHLYVMVNSKQKDDCEEEVDEGDDEESSVDDSDTDSIGPVTEIRFVPSDEASLEPMFAAMSECQALHPDPEDTDSEGDEYDVEEAEQGLIDLPEFSSFEEALHPITLLRPGLQTPRTHAAMARGTQSLQQWGSRGHLKMLKLTIDGTEAVVFIPNQKHFENLCVRKDWLGEGKNVGFYNRCRERHGLVSPEVLTLLPG
ncbi:hypothetical protein UPYG_G00125190 [Umbra pygmaea]|uniref:Methylosome subunit pICln n=1 Tax=Umbra pygmaea TaxID=75934 RepID=A0ABD0X9R9_UMBPY